MREPSEGEEGGYDASKNVPERGEEGKEAGINMAEEVEVTEEARNVVVL